MKKGAKMGLEVGTRRVCGQDRTPTPGRKGKVRPLDFMALSGRVEGVIRKGKARMGHLSNSCMSLPLRATVVLAWEMMVMMTILRRTSTEN
jgi:hypothetical protein